VSFNSPPHEEAFVMPIPNRPRAWLYTASAAFLLAPGTSLGSDAAAVKPTAAPAAGAESLRMFRDPETGALRPATPEEMASLGAPRGQAKRQPLVVKTHSGGMLSAVVGERAMKDLIARRDASGKLIIEHGDAERALTSAPAPTAKREEK
jgi:hypothetical protein